MPPEKSTVAENLELKSQIETLTKVLGEVEQEMADRITTIETALPLFTPLKMELQDLHERVGELEAVIAQLERAHEDLLLKLTSKGKDL